MDELNSEIVAEDVGGGHRGECRRPRIRVDDEQSGKIVRVIALAMKEIQRAYARFQAGFLHLRETSSCHWWQSVVVYRVDIERRIRPSIRNGQLGSIKWFPNKTGDQTGLP